MSTHFLAQIINQIHNFGGYLIGFGVVLMIPYIAWYAILLRKLKRNNYSKSIPEIIKERKKQSIIKHVEYLSYAFMVIGLVLILIGTIVY